MVEVKKRLVIIDGKSVFYRGYYAMPNLATPEGTPTGGVYGFGMMALEIVKQMNPDYVIVAWDKSKTNIRRRVKIYPEYKANRKPAPPDFYEQIPLLHEMLDAFGWPLYEIDDHEADDIMGTFAKQASKKNIETILITSDKDVLQLASDDVTIAILKKGLTNVENFDEKHLRETMDLTPQEFIDFKALRGDASDNIPGVAGIGEKTAHQLISKYGSLDEVYENLDDIKPSVRKKLENDKEMAYTTKELVILDCDIPLDLDLRKADINNLNPQDVQEVFKKFGFRSLLKQLPQVMQIEEEKDNLKGEELGSTMKNTFIVKSSQLSDLQLSLGKYLVINAIASDSLGQDIQTVIISSNTKESIVFQISKDLPMEDVTEKLEAHLEASNVEKIGHDIKKTIKSFLFHNVKITSVGHDTKVGAFLINSLEKEQSLNSLAEKYLDYKGPDLDVLAPDEVQHKAPKIASAIWALYKDQINKFEKMSKIAQLAKVVEWPVIPVLADMEFTGIRLDTKKLSKMSKELNDAISDVEQSIFGYAENEFNISSPRQLSEVLFVRMKLPTTDIRKTKTGYSTAASELAKLQSQHDIIGYISTYRELTKLKNTYVDTLPEMVDDNSRLHTTFSLTTAATGRLSSHDPNLQNIPVRSEMGRKIRRSFISGKGNIFIGADYSQFELRLAAVLSGDKDMIEAFNKGVDIHTRTAAEMYDVEEEKVTKQQRYSAKAVNFGVMYGQGVHGLSEGTGMNYHESKEFIDRYFDIRPKLKEYLDSLKQNARDEGYVETLLGRKRPMPDIHSSNFAVREAAKRAAINMPIQGTAADIMKIAMTKVSDELDDDSKILLQIHDSLLIECPEEKAKDIAEKTKSIMQDAYKLDVELRVDTDIGSNWGEI